MLSKPSTIRLLATGRCPSTDSPDVSAAGSTGPPVVTPAASAASSMNRRPLRGSCSISLAPTMVETAVWEGLTTGAPASTRTVCSMGAMSSAKVTSTSSPIWTARRSRTAGEKPVVLGAQVVLARLERRDDEPAFRVREARHGRCWWRGCGR